MKRLAIGVAGLIAMTLSGCSKGVSEQERLQKVIEAMPWMMQVMESCDAYQQTKSDLDKSELARNHVNTLRTVEVSKVTGVVEKIQNLSPEEIWLQVKVDEDIRFASQSGKRPIKKGTPIFDQAAGLKERDCVIFSANQLEPLAPFELGKVCNKHYFAQFTEVSPCP